MFILHALIILDTLMTFYISLLRRHSFSVQTSDASPSYTFQSPLSPRIPYFSSQHVWTFLHCSFSLNLSLTHLINWLSHLSIDDNGRTTLCNDPDSIDFGASIFLSLEPIFITCIPNLSKTGVPRILDCFFLTWSFEPTACTPKRLALYKRKYILFYSIAVMYHMERTAGRNDVRHHRFVVCGLFCTAHAYAILPNV